MIKRLCRVLAFPLGLLLVIPGIILWIFTNKNLGIKLMEWSILDRTD